MAFNVNDRAELDSPTRSANFPSDFNLDYHRLQDAPLPPHWTTLTQLPGGFSATLGPLGLDDTVLGINNCAQIRSSKRAKIFRGGLPPRRSTVAQTTPRQLSGDHFAASVPPGLGDTILKAQMHSPKRAKILPGARSPLSLVYDGYPPQGLAPKSKAPNPTVNLNHGSCSDGHVSPRAPYTHCLFY